MVLDTFGDSVKKLFSKVTGYTLVDRKKAEAVLLDLQRVLIQSDVDVGLVAELSKRIKDRVFKQKPPSGLGLKEWFIKSLYDELVWFLGKEKAEIGLKKQRILLIGLFGSGKTTTAGKIAKWYPDEPTK